eukprot:gene46582-31399_t
MRANAAAPWACVVADIAGPYITAVPVFAWQSQFDRNQLVSCEQISPSDNAGMQRYGDLLQAALEKWVVRSGAGSGPRHAAFVDSCYRHCGDAHVTAAPTGAAPGAPRVSVKEAFSWWYKQRRRANMTWEQRGAYPCHTCCDAKPLPAPEPPSH